MLRKITIELLDSDFDRLWDVVARMNKRHDTVLPAWAVHGQVSAMAGALVSEAMDKAHLVSDMRFKDGCPDCNCPLNAEERAFYDGQCEECFTQRKSLAALQSAFHEVTAQPSAEGAG